MFLTVFDVVWWPNVLCVVVGPERRTENRNLFCFSQGSDYLACILDYLISMHAKTFLNKKSIFKTHFLSLPSEEEE
jgi:hypothetical protein